jgi:hypothetical protein
MKKKLKKLVNDDSQITKRSPRVSLRAASSNGEPTSLPTTKAGFKKAKAKNRTIGPRSVSRSPSPSSTMGRIKTKSRSNVSERQALTSLSGIALGDSVRLTWQVDPAYGGFRASFVGVVEELEDGWIKAVDNNGVIFHWSLKDLTVKKL